MFREQDVITGLYCRWLCYWTETSWRLCRKNSTASTFPFLSKTDSVNLLSLWENEDQERTRLHLLREAQPCGVAGKRGVMGRCYFKCNNLCFSGKGKTGRFIFWRHILGSTTMFFFLKISLITVGFLLQQGLQYLDVVKWWSQLLGFRILFLSIASLLFIQGIWFCSQSLLGHLLQKRKYS